MHGLSRIPAHLFKRCGSGNGNQYIKYPNSNRTEQPPPFTIRVFHHSPRYNHKVPNPTTPINPSSTAHPFPPDLLAAFVGVAVFEATPVSEAVFEAILEAISELILDLIPLPIGVDVGVAVAVGC